MPKNRILTVAGLVAGLSLPLLAQPAFASTPPAGAAPAAQVQTTVKPQVTTTAQPQVTKPATTQPATTQPATTSPATTQPATTPPAATQPSAAATASAMDAAFLSAAHQIDMAEIAAGGLAASKGASASVRTLGATLVSDHKAMDIMVTTTARDLGVTLPDTPTSDQLALTKKYLAASGATFDRLYLRTELAGHRMALKGIAAELKQGSDVAVKKVAKDAAPTVKAHIVALKAAKTAEVKPATMK